jgi:hypothetical protein
MSNTSGSQTHNQPSHEAQVKGGQDSHQGGSYEQSREPNGNQPGERNSGQNQSGHDEFEGQSGENSGSYKRR